MRDLIRVLVLGAGRMGSGVARVLLDKEGLEIVGACDPRGDLSGSDIGRICGLDEDTGITVESDLATALSHSRPDIAIQATGSTLTSVAADIELLLEHGASVISIAASRSNDLSPYGPTILEAQGVGLTPDEFQRGVQAGTITGHVGFDQSLHMMAASLGWRIERVEQTLDPIVARIPREAPLVRVEPGQVAGCLHRAIAHVDGRPAIALTHPQQVCPDAEGIPTSDRIEIRGRPDICLEGTPEIPGGEGTAAIVVNMIPRVLGATPGLRTMADLPVPAALHGDMRSFVQPTAERRHG